MKLIRRLALCLMIAGGAAAWSAEPVAPAAAAQAPEVAEAPPQPLPGQIGEQDNYIIGPGDVIQIFVWRHPDLSISVPVRSDGKVTTPLVEDIVAVGLTPSGLARSMEQRLAEYVRTPQVNVIVTSAQSAYSKITVIGQVRTPQAVPYQQGMTVLDVVLAVGGLGEFASGNRARLIRKDADGKEKEIRVKLADLVNKGRISENIELQPGDILIVPESIF